MKFKKACIGFACVLFVLLGLVFAAYYFDVYLSNVSHSIYLAFALLAISESLTAGISFYLSIFKNCKSKFAKIIYLITAVLALPVLLVTMFWILYFVGVQLIPAMQQ